MLEPVSVGLKFGFLAVLYLFLLWIVRSALKDLRRGPEQAQLAVPSDATGLYAAADGLLGAEEAEFDPRLLVERAAGHEPGSAYEIPYRGATLGRADAEIRLEDPFASSRHAHISRQGQVLVIEDLGSTNGTYLNEEPLSGPQPLHPGDRIRIGDSEFTYLQ